MTSHISIKHSTIVKNKKKREIVYAQNKSVLDYIISASLEHSNARALTCDNVTITHLEFLKKCLSIATQLKKYGIKKGDKVALYVPNSDKLVILVVASLMVGACYIPIDNNYPIERVKYILEDSNPSLVIFDSNNSTDISVFDAFQIAHVKTFVFNDNFPKKDIYDFKNINLQGSDPAYIIYTSGSTGNPKGIVIPHSAINNHMIWMSQEFKFSSHDKFLLKTPITFDASVWEMLMPFYLGAELVVFRSLKSSDITSICEYITRNKITVLQLVPALLYALLCQSDKNQLKSLRFIFSGGESLPAVTKKKFFKVLENCNLINLYGPAEATIDTTFYQVKNNQDKIKKDIIGKPISNVKLHIVDSNNEPCPLGAVGQLLISGDSLALGYLNNENISSKSFIYDAKISEHLLYKTGDLVRWNEDNELEYCGRIDNQVKINGVRIELEEIKSHILSIDGIYECAFDKITDKILQNSTLVCYILTNNNAAIDSNKVKSFLKTKLPDYMVPGLLHIVGKLEFTCNGKIDLNKIKTQLASKNHEDENKTEAEKTLLSLWNQVLPESINSVNVSFFDVGGDSIKTSILAHLISKKFNLEINLTDLAVCDTVSKQAVYIDSFTKLEMRNPNIKSLNSTAPIKIFLVHPVGGTIFWYLPLAKLLDKKVQIYGISDPGLNDKTHPYDTLEDLAKYYASLIQMEQPNGPYWIGGASFGATVAIEIAKYLKQSGCQINPIQVFDGWALYPAKLQDKKYFENSMLRQQEDWVNKFNEGKVEKSCYQDLLSLQMKRLKMLYRYSPATFDIPIKLYKATEIMPIFAEIDSVDNHWKSYAKYFENVLMPGSHETMFQVQNAYVLSAEIYASLTAETFNLLAS